MNNKLILGIAALLILALALFRGCGGCHKNTPEIEGNCNSFSIDSVQYDAGMVAVYPIDTTFELRFNCSSGLLEWDLDNNGSFEHTGNPVKLKFDSASIYMVHVRQQNVPGDVYSLSLDIRKNAPEASFICVSDFIVVGDTIAFQSTSFKANSFEWDMGDGSPLKKGESITHVYPKTGTYTVRLKINGAHEGKQVYSEIITVEISGLSWKTAPRRGKYIVGKDVFEAELDPSITGVVWVMGDGSAPITGPKIRHVFKGKTDYIKITFKDKTGKTRSEVLGGRNNKNYYAEPPRDKTYKSLMGKPLTDVEGLIELINYCQPNAVFMVNGKAKFKSEILIEYEDLNLLNLCWNAKKVGGDSKISILEFNTCPNN